MDEPEIPPRLQGTVRLADGRRLAFAEFGPPGGRPVVWLHGTPGARRQIPHDARAYAEEHDVRIIGIDRPGVGGSTAHLYDQIQDFTDDFAVLCARLGIEEVAVIGLSGGGPYALAAGARLPGLVSSVGVLGGVAPTEGPDGISGGMVSLATFFKPILPTVRAPLGRTLVFALRGLRPVSDLALAAYARISPPGDRALLNRPEFKAMFLDDLLSGSRRQFSAPFTDAILFTRHWGFTAAEVQVPVRWWHGDADHIIPFAHGEHMVERLPDATLTPLPGESHLGGLSVGSEVIDTLLALGSVPARRTRRTADGTRQLTAVPDED